MKAIKEEVEDENQEDSFREDTQDLEEEKEE